MVVVPSSSCTHQTWLVIVQAKFDGTEDNHVESTTLISEVGVPTKSCQTSLDSESNHLDLDLTSANLSITSHLGVGGVRTASGSKVAGWIFSIFVGRSSLRHGKGSMASLSTC